VFDFTINIQDATTQTKADIEQALSDYLLSLSPYNEGVSLERLDAVTDTGANGAANDIAREANATILQLTMRVIHQWYRQLVYSLRRRKSKARNRYVG
jgi:hypothetical protein